MGQRANVEELIGRLAGGKGKKARQELVDLAFTSAENLAKVWDELQKVSQGPRSLRREAARTQELLRNKLVSQMTPGILHRLIQESEYLEVLSQVIGEAAKNFESSLQLGNLLFQIYFSGKVDEEQKAGNFESILILGFSDKFAAEGLKSPLGELVRGCQGWLSQLFQGVAQSNQKAVFLIESMLSLHAGKGFYLEPVEESEYSFEHYEKSIFSVVQKTKEEVEREKPITLFWPVPSEYFPLVEPIYQSVREYFEERAKQEQELSCWVTEQEEVLLTKINHLWQEIVSYRKWGIRDKGADRVKISILGLNLFGLSSFSFIREGHRPPEVKVRLFGEWLGKSLYRDYILRDGKLEGFSSTWPLFIFLPFTYMVVDSYHKIVVQGKKERPMRKERKEESQIQREREKKWQVRPHPRELQPGWKPYPEAPAAALKYTGRPLPPGFTFVQPHTRGEGEEELTFLFAYSQKDLE